MENNELERMKMAEANKKIGLNKKIDSEINENEESVDEGLGVLIKKKILYHGSGTSEIQTFTKAIDDTVGSGMYCTSESEAASGYARIRSKSEKSESPVVYEVSIENLKLLDLRNTENIQKILPGFRKILLDHAVEPDAPWWTSAASHKSIEAIDQGKVGAGRLKEVTSSHGELFTQYVQSLGYEGVIALEGGEGQIGNHDTYLIFDPDKIKIIQEQKQ